MTFMCHNKRRSRPVDLTEGDKRSVLAMVEAEMAERDRLKAAEEAAFTWSPNMMNRDPGMIRFARTCYAAGYAAALGECAQVDGPLEDREHKPLEQEWPVAPC